MAKTLVIRFGALGDLCICSWFLAGMAEEPAHRPLILATKTVFAPLAAAIPGLDHVLSLDPGGPHHLLALARTIQALGPVSTIDAHSVIRSHALSLLLGRRPASRLNKDTALRRRLVRTARQGQAVDRTLRMHLLDRFDALVTGSPGRNRLAPTIRPPLAHLGGHSDSGAIGLVPGAKWASKRWPDSMFSELSKVILEAPTTHIKLFVGPQEQSWFDASPLTRLDPARVEIIAETDLIAVARQLGACRRVVGNDSGLMHLAEAVGTPVITIFGPTIPAFGYTPLLPRSRLIETDLSCRPCSKTGAAPCRRHDLACLTTITPRHVHEALVASLSPENKPERRC